MVNRTKDLLHHKKLNNPWKDFEYSHQVAPEDKLVLSKEDFEDIKKRIFWDNEDKEKFSYQFPMPINGNFYKAKYLLLYSNPATEEKEINDSTKAELMKCFTLDEEAKLVIDDWEDWYIGELDKFFILPKKNKLEFDLDDFFNDFCFINLFAYQTQENEFNFKAKELSQLHLLPTTSFVKNLVEIGKAAGKEILVIRRSEGVWKHSTNDEYMFEKLGSYYKKQKKLS